MTIKRYLHTKNAMICTASGDFVLLKDYQRLEKQLDHYRALTDNYDVDRQKLAAENTALKQTILALGGKGLRFFTYEGPDAIYDEHDTMGGAIKQAEDALDYCRDCAGEGWPDETGQICWGVVVQRATMHNQHKPAPETEDTSFDYICEYDLMGVNPDAAIAEIKGWTCFHCGEHFHAFQANLAALHFGGEQDAIPRCKDSLEKLSVMTTAFMNLQHLSEVYRSAYEESKERIAELEARAVKLPPEVWVKINDVNSCVMYAGDVIYALKDAGVKLSGNSEQVLQHSDDEAFDRFAIACKAKLAKSRAKGRRGWDDPHLCSVESLAAMLVAHLVKGNPGTFEDVANFAMMLHQRKASHKILTEAAKADRFTPAERDAIKRALDNSNSPVIPDGWALVPQTATDAMISAAGRAARQYMEEMGGNNPSVIYNAMLAAAPQRKDVKMQFNAGDYCIHTSKWEKSPCRVVAYDGDVVVIKRLGSGYNSVPESSLAKITKKEAIRMAQQMH
ncbi:hypothetical protein [Brenneria corticis]|uniref:Uncharacterized protein n=1 Tax=Brenneria corticis TaxID=2173106 RepID=A0A2U1TM80_9GAMM|nr:hypothetical protein [Brenneria sp. CFCC 11842]PWC10505.1 hypothetical protein DDT56_21560 [Brenneria sp. CFCC 11842]